MEVEELEKNNPISLSVERRRGTFGRLTVHWAASGSLEDIYPPSGVVSQLCPHNILQTHDGLCGANIAAALSSEAILNAFKLLIFCCT